MSSPRRMLTENQLAAEVVDLGETLFDALLERAESWSPTENRLAMDSAEARSAADEFFAALRLLLSLDEDDA